MINLLSFVIIAYLLLRWVWPMRLALPMKALLAALVVLLAKQHWIVAKLMGTTIASPEIPRAVLLAVSVGFGFLMLLTILLVLRDLIGALVWLLSRSKAVVVLGSRALANALAVIALLLSAIGVWQAVQLPQVREVEVTLDHLPQALDGYSIVQLTDLHASRLLEGSWLEAVVERSNALKPDLIVITGDLVDGTVAARRNDVPALARLSAPDGVFGIPGNHEYYAGYSEWMSAFKALGIHMLVNAHVLVGRDSAAIVLAGLADRVGPPRGLPGPDVAAALRGRPAGKPVILMEHQPRNARANAIAGADLQLSGHTHGGHIRGFDVLVQRANAGFVSGRYDVNGMQLYVSNGAGLWAGFPYRLGRPAEITRITLRAPQRAVH